MMEICHQCQAPQSVWSVVRCSNPTKEANCREAFCFKCLSQNYPQMYGGVFKGLCWLCPGCVGLCQCEICKDPVKKQELQRQFALERARKLEEQGEVKITYHRERGIFQMQQLRRSSVGMSLDDADDGWSCPRCSVVNTLDEVECTACYYHRKRTSRKRCFYEAPIYEEKYHVHKETKRARDIKYDDKSPPVKGRVSALRQLVKRPWTDGWELARKLALDLVEEAKVQAIKSGLPLSQVRQLPTKYQLANNRNTHVRKWFDREPTLAKKFLRAAGLICSKSNGTFIKEDIGSLEDLPVLIRKADMSMFNDEESIIYSGDDYMDAESSMGTSTRSMRRSLLDSSVDSMPSPSGSPIISSMSSSLSSSSSSSPSSSPSRSSPHSQYQPKVKVYYHPEAKQEPFVFKVPIADLKTMEELYNRLSLVLNEMGQQCEKQLVLKKCLEENDACNDMITTIHDISQSAPIHAVHVQ